jgi:hypothetical protein
MPLDGSMIVSALQALSERFLHLGRTLRLSTPPTRPSVGT